VGTNETERTAWQVSHITDKKAIQLIKDKKVRFGSPTVLKYSDSMTQEMMLGNGKIQSTLHRFIPAHDAIVGEPAYGEEVDKIKAVCDGDGPGCGLKLREVSASINSNNVNQLTIVPFVKKALKQFKPETLQAIVEYSKETKEADLDTCVSRKIKIIADEHSSWDHDQIIAVAYSYCKEKSSEIESMILGDLTPELLNTREKLLKSRRDKFELLKNLDIMSDKLQLLKS